LKIRKATVKDAKTIHSLVNRFAQKDTMLPRSLNEIYDICTNKSKIVGTSALHIMWEDLAEIRSIAVLREYHNKGIGKKLIEECLKEAQALGVKKIFVLTYNPDFFKKIGFHEIDKNTLPQKIWGDCLKCPKFPECDEVALIKTFH
jgi:amino-acid N-acetyltransferase